MVMYLQIQQQEGQGVQVEVVVVIQVLQEQEIHLLLVQHKELLVDHINTHHLIDKVVEEVVQYVLEALELVLPLKQEEMEQDYQQGLVLMESLVEVIDIMQVAVQEDQDPQAQQVVVKVVAEMVEIQVVVEQLTLVVVAEADLVFQVQQVEDLAVRV